MTYIDLFAGAGGMSEGFVRNGFTPVAHIEADREACFTLKTRTAYYYLLQSKKSDVYFDYLKGKITRADLYAQVPANLLDQVMNVEISRWTLENLFESILHSVKRIGVSQVDAIVGGPPCQPFSIIGRGALNNNKTRERRANLYRFFAEFLIAFKPKIFVFENVPGLLSAKNGRVFRKIQASVESAGYHMEIRTLDAHDFGVLQQRRRLILIGWPKKTDLQYPSFGEKANGYLVNQLFSDLPTLEPSEDGSGKGYASIPTAYLVHKGLRRTGDVLTQHVTRPHNERDREIYGLTIEAWLNERRRLKYTDLPVRLKTRKNETAFLDRFKVVAGDITYSHTLLAHIAKDGHYYIHPSLKQLRSLSVREAARIQSFPDNYYFEGWRTSAFRQIGNAVPPLMAETIASEIKRMLL